MVYSKPKISNDANASVTGLRPLMLRCGIIFDATVTLHKGITLLIIFVGSGLDNVVQKLSERYLLIGISLTISCNAITLGWCDRHCVLASSYRFVEMAFNTRLNTETLKKSFGVPMHRKTCLSLLDSSLHVEVNFGGRANGRMGTCIVRFLWSAEPANIRTPMHLLVRPNKTSVCI